MPGVDLVVETKTPVSARVRQVSGMFDAPVQKRLRHHWQFDVPYDDEPWNVGLIVGPSGSGKTSVARKLFGEHVDVELKWSDRKSILDDFAKNLSIKEITNACSAVGFNTIPSWMKPYRVLSNGERFRVSLARRLLECADPVVVDEFTSIVDRQVAKIAAHAVQKFVRRSNRKFVAVSCHYDVIDWLQPDWLLRVDKGTFERRLLQRRPALDCEIARVDHSAWRLFAPYHYMTAELNKAALCWCLFLDGQPAAFSGLLFRPISQGILRQTPIFGLSRTVTLPDFQGIGLHWALNDTLAAAFRYRGFRYRQYPAHPALVWALQRSPVWKQSRGYGQFTARATARPTKHGLAFGGRMNAVFEYCGPPADEKMTQTILGDVGKVQF